MAQTGIIQIHFSSSSDDEDGMEQQKQGIVVSNSQNVEPMEVNSQVLPGISSITPLLSYGSQDITIQQQGILEKSLQKSNEDSSMLKKVLEDVKERQIAIKSLVAGEKNNEVIKSRIRQDFKELQISLATINKDLSKKKQAIKDEREASQQSHAGSSQSLLEDKLLNKAKTLIVYQKALVHLLKTHKQLTPLVKKFLNDQEGEKLQNVYKQTQNVKQQAELQGPHKPRLKEQPSIKKHQLNQHHHLKTQSLQHTVKQTQNQQQHPKDFTVLQRLMNANIIKPGENVLSIATMGAQVMASLRSDSVIVSKKGTFTSLEKWVYQERNELFSKKSVLKLYSTQKWCAQLSVSHVTRPAITGTSEIIEMLITLNNRAGFDRNQSFKMLVAQRYVRKASGFGTDSLSISFPQKVKYKGSLINTLIQNYRQSSPALENKISIDDGAKADMKKSTERFQLNIAVSKSPGSSGENHLSLRPIRTEKDDFLSCIIKIRIFQDEEFTDCTGVVPETFWNTGFETYNDYARLIEGCPVF